MPSILASPRPLSISSFITIGNGTQLPITHTASPLLLIYSSPLLLNNILISAHMIKNLISMRKLTCDNNVSIEFDPDSFSNKDLKTRTVKLCS